MEVIRLRGGNKLSGSITVHGAKNAILPILAGSVINGGKSVIHNCPDLKDVRISFEILRHLGCSVLYENSTVTVDSSNICNSSIPPELMLAMRSSVIFAGALLNRWQKASITYPGGCNLGHRPIDLHLRSFDKLGIIIKEEHGSIFCEAPHVTSGRIFLDFPSVGATENIMLLACRGDGVTTIINAAREPEIVDLQNFLNSMGADIKGAGTDTIEITGVKKFHDCEYFVMPDRIVASTYMASVVSAGGWAEINSVVPSHISAFIAVMRECGAKISVRENSVYISSPTYIRPIKMVSTLPYPGFPTDAQSLVMSVMSTARGASIIKENIFSSRFALAGELIKMGADISVADKIAVVRGVRKLFGCRVAASDLRSGAALAVASLNADGETVISNVDYIDRGYEKLEESLRLLGADAERVELSE